ncbi:MAG: ergothioneine biosynthesis protein EgtB, partial [Xanthobacteraceae bacterium]
VRAATVALAAPLSPEDCQAQSMPDASPVKWHLAHTTWFFETFLLGAFAPEYRPAFPEYRVLFNSYYNSVGRKHPRPERGLLTRPTLAQVMAYRDTVDDAMVAAIDRLADGNGDAGFASLLTLGINHEQQHQELILTDILHAFAQNPTAPAYAADWTWPTSPTGAGGYCTIEGIHTVGHDGKSFMFDNEGPAHEVLIAPVKLARNLVTNAEWLEFMAERGYETAALWLSDGWSAVQSEGWTAPGYWQQIDGVWFAMTLRGLTPVDPAAPVCHISYYEADAFARWAGKHLPSEAEWEVAARARELTDVFGLVWQWTRSAYAPYPGYRAATGALGEYNGKFMINQMVLRGSSLATPDGHARVTYRNFFYPPHRWQFTGLRLADYDL